MSDNINSPATDFECDNPGRNSHAVSKYGMPVGNHVKINGTDDLRDIIKFGEGGCVSQIDLEKNDSFDEQDPENCYKYIIWITCQGPKKGYGYLTFNDKTGDHYGISIYSTSLKKHYIRYGSNKPDIISIIWSDDGI